MDSMISIENLTVEFVDIEGEEPRVAVDGVSAEIEKGSFTAIIGRNGSGKSTLAKAMNALILPTEGKVITAGFDTANDKELWKVRQSAGMVFQNPDNQLVSAIVEDDVAFGPENIGVNPEDIKKRVKNALKDVDMLEHRKKAPHTLSGGQKQRIAIAGIIAMKPACIIFDEPTAMLDPRGRSEVMNIIKKLHEEGITVVLITHFMEEAAQADKILIMKDGQIALEGTPEEVFAQRQILFDAGLEIPFAADVAGRLRQKGISIEENVLDMEDLVEAICQLK